MRARWLAGVLLLLTSCAGPAPDAPAGPAVPSGPSSSPPDGPGASAPPGVPAVSPPPPGAVADYQLGGAYPPAADVRVVVRDRTAEPAAGLYSVCYVNAFQTQPQETDTWLREHPDLLLSVDGGPVGDPGWPGEFLLDTSSADRRAALADVVGAWVDGCADAGFQAVEADNLDSATRSDGALTMADAYAYSALLSARAHARGLAYAQKNAPETTAEQARAAGFDFAVAESCELYAECDDYTAVHADRVLEVEYSDDGREPFEAACAARGGQVSVVYRDRELLPRGVPGYEFDHC